MIHLPLEECLVRTEHNWLPHPHITSLRSVVNGFIFFTHLRDCSVKTELIRRNNYAKKVSIVVWVAVKRIDKFPCPLLLSCPLENEVVARKSGHPLSANSTNIFSTDIVLDSLWTVLFEGRPLFLRAGTNVWPLSCSNPPCIQGYDLSVCHTFLFIVFRSTGNVAEHRLKRVLPVKFSGVSPNLLS